ncbi:MAG: hypothetical protein IK010_07135, partial [Bacteroidales bacterium]|nr:hypothetical protein [Bacteroidales bacterium]
DKYYINNQKRNKKMKKYITIPVLATVTLLLAIGIVVACTKENTNKTTATETPRSTMKLTTEQKLANGVYNVWQKSDSTYRANTTGFRSTCGEEDLETFYEMTNIASAQIDSIGVWANKLYGHLTGEVSTDIPLCLECNTSLSNYGLKVAAMRNVINELEQYQDSDTIPCFTPYINDSCFLLCHATLGYSINNEATAWCLLNCSISKELDRMSRHLAAVKADE